MNRSASSRRTITPIPSPLDWLLGDLDAVDRRHLHEESRLVFLECIKKSLAGKCDRLSADLTLVVVVLVCVEDPREVGRDDEVLPVMIPMSRARDTERPAFACIRPVRPQPEGVVDAV
jgi:hypothetical protein